MSNIVARNGLHDALELLAEQAGNDPSALLMVARAMAATRPERAVEIAKHIMNMVPGTDLARAAAMILKDMVPGWHFVIVRDAVRNAAYDQALRKAVTPDSRVLDIGTGTGLLAMMAARAGARDVFTCEQNAAVTHGAAAVLAANGFADQIRLIEKHSSQLDCDRDLGGPVDVLVSEIISNDVVGQGCLAVMEQAGRWLKPNGKIIPQAATVRVALAWSDAAEARRLGTIDGFDLSAFNSLERAVQQHAIGDTRLDIRSSVADLIHFDFRSDGPFRPVDARTMVISDGRPFNGVLQWLRLDMDESIVYENRPRAGAKSCWAALFYPLGQSIEPENGQEVCVAGAHDRASLHIWVEQQG